MISILNMLHLALCLLLSVSGTAAFAPLQGVTIQKLSGEPVDLGSYLGDIDSGRTLFLFGTYAADFNSIEYVQRLKYYLPQLRSECQIDKVGLLLNCQPSAATKLLDMLDLDAAANRVDVFVDNTGAAARAWGVNRGWLADEEYKDINPFLKLFGMLWGLGAWATLPAVIGGYVGNPLLAQPWITDALAVGQRKGRWPDTALEMGDDGSVSKNKFSELPLVGSWPRRPLELATLRLQSMIGVSLAEWKDLAPDDEALKAGVLTQLGGCLVLDERGDILYEYKDPGICAVMNFETLPKRLKRRAEKS